jgi:hypothetical protein
MTDSPDETRIRRALQTAAATVESAAVAIPTSAVSLPEPRHRPRPRTILVAVALALLLSVGALAVVGLGRTNTKAAAEAGWDPRTGVCTSSEADQTGGLYGSDSLAVVLPANQADPLPAIPYDGGYYFKVGWRRGVAGPLTIDLERLDGPGSGYAEIPDGYPQTGMQASGIVVSAPGCWRVTGHLDDATLSFVSHVGVDGQGD